ncbi:hypothetical protein L873DRAFT_1792715 [Choiromyces venosus 120613-1]|uniref:Amine oxidase domain-containing protein n=1 Tax=Choiromyces venosus 120613-1 TaxID=1336337 RepID=A0A3N4J996_9PEZI|nr:hypothetical protein L873DRAFT_1792715 [Choiromyces venosus 120613-1]
MRLDDLGLPYEIIEASDRHGGRAYTYHFETPPNPNFHNYYDVGAMRFPRTSVMKLTFNLFDELGLTKDGKIIPYIMNAPNNIQLFNGRKVIDGGIKVEDDDPFHVSVSNGGTFKYTRRDGTELVGVEALLAEAYDPFKNKLVDDFKTGWKYLMTYDYLSTRGYLGQIKGYPFSVIEWMETMDNSTLAYDQAFSGTIIDSIDFDYPFGPNDPPGSVMEWACVDGGTSVVTDRMADRILTKPLYNRRVTAIAMAVPDLKKDNPNNPNMKISVQDHPEYEAKRLDYVQNQALRCLEYGPAIKVGIKFKTRWWQQIPGFGMRGGVSSTDRPTRIVVYPSYGLDDPENANGVLIASYCWTQDASRLGALIKGKGTEEEKVLLDIIYKDLSEMHGNDPQWYKDQTVDYYAHDWYHDQYSIGGQFKNLYPELTKPAAKGNLHFVGEATSAHHAWIVGALESAFRGINEVLIKEKRDDLRKKHAERWEQGEVERGYQAQMQCLRGIYGF